MRLLVILNVFHPDRGGGAAVFSDLFFSLAERGFDVTVRCAYPYYPEWQDKSGLNGLRIQRYEERGVKVERYGLYLPRDPQSLRQRILYEGSFLLSLMRSLHRGRSFDAVMVYCPLVGSVAFATVNKWVHRKPLWLNVQDLSADAAAASGISRFRSINVFLEWIQDQLFNSAHLWSSISPVMIERLREIRKRDQPILYLPNWLNASLAEEIAKLPNKIGRLPRQPVRLLYAGNIGDKQDLLLFCKILQAGNSDFHFKIHGNGSVAQHVERWIQETGDPRFSFGPFLDEAAFARALHDTDLFVITEIEHSVGAFIPSKSIPGMATQTPILAVCDEDSPLGLEMKLAQPGYWFPWSRLQEVHGLISSLSDHPTAFVAAQQNAYDRAAAYDRNEVIDRFAAALRQFAAGEAVSDQLNPFALKPSSVLDE